MQAKHYKFGHINIGHGGIKCPCCADKSSKKAANRKFRRATKRILPSE